MTTDTVPPAARPVHRPDALARTVRVLFGIFGTVKLVGTAYFSFVASPEDHGVVGGTDWLVAGWSALLAVAYLAVAFGLARGGRRLLALTGGLLAVDVVFSLVKILVYDEQEAAGFLAVTLILGGMLALVARRAH